MTHLVGKIMKLVNALINSNIYISLAAVFLTLQTQIQIGLKPQWHPYLFIVFFATLFEYNLQKLITLGIKKLSGFHFFLFISIIGFFAAVSQAKKEVIFILVPIALLTLFYSYNLRKIPYLKIFLIAFVWSAATIFLPITQSNNSFNKIEIILIVLERFLFVFAITIPFDIRDVKSDQKAELKTLPLLLSENNCLMISNFALIAFLLISFFHYQVQNLRPIFWPLCISSITTLVFINHKKIRKLPHYHYGILDGAMILQGILVLVYH